VDRWAADVASRLRPETAPANRRIAYLFSRVLAYPSHAIVAQKGTFPLQQLAVDFEAEYARMNQIPSALAREQFRPYLELDARSRDRHLCEYFTPSRAVTHWTEAVHRRRDAAVHRQVKQGLRIIFDLADCRSYEIIAFLFTHCLALPSGEVSRFAEKPVDQVAPVLEVLFGDIWDASTIQVRTWFRPLHKRIAAENNTGVPHTGVPLRHFFTCDCDAGVADVGRWRTAVLRRVRPLFAGGRTAVLFAWRHRLL
jgi:hypothetical protein